MKYLLLIPIILICNNICIAQNVPFYVPQNGLVAWWPFTGNAIDSSGNGNNGTLVNITPASDRFGNPNHAYSFTGSGSYISVPNSASLASPTTRLSISAWINMAVVNSFAPVLCKSNSSTNAFMYNFGVELSLLFSETNNFNAPVSAAYSFSLNQWYMVTVVLDSSTASFYVNGSLINTKPYITNITQDTRPMEIGADPPGATEYFDGIMDDIGIWNRALTACEIHQLYYGEITSITMQPAGVSVVNGDTGIFSVGSTDSCLLYQWQQNEGTGFTNLTNAGVYSGTDNDSLIINPVSDSMNNYSYRCIISSCLFCADTTNEVVLNVINPSPVATFSADDTIFCINNCINFTNLSVNATSWQWSFAGGTPDTSTSQSPQSICYKAAGDYDVTLIAYNAGERDSITLSSYIHVKPAPPTPVITIMGGTLYCSTDTAYSGYQWYDSTTLIPGATDTLLVITQGGNYNVQVTNADSCKVAVGINVLFTGITPFITNNTFSVFPNPLTASSSLQFNGELKNAEVIIYDLPGKEIMCRRVNGSSMEIGRGRLESGIYFVKVIDGARQYVQKIVVD